ncbi:MAG: UDP-N-acetylmuramoyl-tripeptide--D-alanyl-D-alanine ligase [Gammaproteobacteria bacterium]|nr:UDP-N-acetylmuramoyl-tripeptide--D-alanyl-D-alanine ligase [Gammaproteobacteria bacterium]
MISGTLKDAAGMMDAQMLGVDARFAGVSTDSRQTRDGELFFALDGPNFDGHTYVRAALTAGAPAAVVDRELAVRPLLLTDDTRMALGKLAVRWRTRCAPRVVAVTGSNGKTTVKEMLASILAAAGPTLATSGNLNNDVGLPLTLLQLAPSHRYAVTELGANHRGEIAYLTQLAKPDVAVITNATAAHLEGFGSVTGVAQAKGEIFLGLAAAGTAVINADDRHISLWRSLAASFKVLTFGVTADADVHAELADGHLHLTFDEATASVPTTLVGQHNARNAAAACAAALAFDLPLAKIAERLAQVRPVSGRLQFKTGAGGAVIIDDTYNANPASLQVALQVLAEQPQPHKYVLLGDMAELGEQGPQLHEQAGAAVREQGVQLFYAVGELARHAALGFGAGSVCFDEPSAAAQALRGRLTPEVCVLVKGSRAMRMERALALLLDHRAPSAGRG